MPITKYVYTNEVTGERYLRQPRCPVCKESCKDGRDCACVRRATRAMDSIWCG